MSEKLLELLRELNVTDIETMLAYQCAPLITGLKCSNLLIMNGPHQLKALYSIIEQTDIASYILYENEHKIIILLYRENKLKNYLNKADAKKVLRMFGYHTTKLNLILEEITKRYEAYMNTKKNFPHEIGVILGYPMEDVVGFIRNHGKQYICNKYWKVYGNVSSKKAMFRQYDKAKEAIVQLIAYGISMREIIIVFVG